MIYIAREVTSGFNSIHINGKYEIGFSDVSVAARIKALNAKSPHPWILEVTFTGDIKYERMLHKAFHANLVPHTQEMFFASPEIYWFVEGVKAAQCVSSIIPVNVTKAKNKSIVTKIMPKNNAVLKKVAQQRAKFIAKQVQTRVCTKCSEPGPISEFGTLMDNRPAVLAGKEQPKFRVQPRHKKCRR